MSRRATQCGEHHQVAPCCWSSRRLQLRDLTIANRVKDELLKQAGEREALLIGEVREEARRNGMLETRLLAIEGPTRGSDGEERSVRKIEVVSIDEPP